MTEPLGDALASISVITRKDIQLSVAQDLLGLLRLQPGVDIVRSGGLGAQTSVFLRGGNSNHVLVLIDGVRVSSSNTGAYTWEQLPVNQIERIEIVRGPRGSIYGSDSIGGVIQVFTRSSPDPYARLTGGSFGTVEFEGGLGYEGDRIRLSVNAGYRDADGFSAQNPDGFSHHPDDDGFEGINLGIKGSADTDFGSWHFNLLALDNESEFDQGVSDARQFVTSLEFQSSFSPRWQYQVRVVMLTMNSNLTLSSSPRISSPIATISAGKTSWLPVNWGTSVLDWIIIMRKENPNFPGTKAETTRGCLPALTSISPPSTCKSVAALMTIAGLVRSLPGSWQPVTNLATPGN